VSKPVPDNPYIVGPPLTDEHGFYGRQNLVEEVVRALAATRQNTVVLHGQRRIGKSSLLHRLRRDQTLRDNHLPIFVDMQGYGGYLPARVIADLAGTINRELGLQLAIPTETDLRVDYNLFHRVFLPEVYPHLGQKQLLWLIDEFDVVVPTTVSGAEVADTLLGFFRTLIAEEPSKLAFIFVIGKRLSLLGEGYQRLFKAAHAQPVGRLDRSETIDLLCELGTEGGIAYSDEALVEIWALTNGHPYLVQLLGSEIFNHLHKHNRQQATSEDVTACVHKAMEHGQGALDWFWSGFGPEQQWVLSAVADLTDHGQSVSDAEIDKALQQHLLFLSASTLEEASKDLWQGDFLIQTDRRYRFAVEFIRRWIVKNHPIEEIQREIEDISQEALNYYQAGRRAFGRGSLQEAIRDYGQALEHNPHFVRVHLDLAVALRAQGDLPAAISEYELTYQNMPKDAREGLVDVRLAYARQLKQKANDKGVLEQAERILEINPEHEEARHMVSEIYRERIQVRLSQNNFDEALDLLKKLADLIPIVQETEVSEPVRALWLDYSDKMTHQDPPDWGQAQFVLNSLKPLDLLNDQILVAYNQVTLAKAQSFLELHQLKESLATLKNELKEPLPNQVIKEMLIGYLQQQIDEGNWLQANQSLEGLCGLVEDEQTRVAQLDFYRRWGDALLTDGNFDEAIEVYQRGASKEFDSAIANAYMRKAESYLVNRKLPQAKASYEQALSTYPHEAIRAEARQALETYFHKRQERQAWSQASAALDIMRELGVSQEHIPSLETNLYLAQARAELSSGLLDEAFGHLALLSEGSAAQIKNLVLAYLRQSATQKDWAAGDMALKHLQELMPGDQESTVWRANWTFFWSQALFPDDKLDQQPLQALDLCRKALESLEDDTPYLGHLRGETEPSDGQALPAGLRQRVCILLAAILLDQAQTSLDKAQLLDAQNHFREALDLPVPPDDLEQKIKERLYGYHRRQLLKENPDEARSALTVMLELDVAGPETEDALRAMPADQARQRLKADEPTQAFIDLKQQQSDLSDEERKAMEAVFYQFSRLYAGRTRWTEAKQVLRGLHDDWAPPNEAALSWLDDLNREELAFVRGRHEVTPVSREELALLTHELEVVEDGYREARGRGLETLPNWIEDFIETGLALGRAHLSQGDLDSASAVYQQILGIDSDQKTLRDRVSQSLHNYSERMLDNNQWDMARQALVALKRLFSATSDEQEQARQHMRADGAIQRVCLAQAEAWLKADRGEEIFEAIQKDRDLLPRPWPTGALKEVVRADYQARVERDDWTGAVAILRRLDQLLMTDPPLGRDPDVLRQLIEGLWDWGHHLEEHKNLEDATRKYSEALEHTRQTVEELSQALAKDYIRVTLRLAENCLKEEATAAQGCADFATAILYYHSILALPECKAEDAAASRAALYAHSRRLAQQQAWSEAHYVLGTVQELFPRPPTGLKKEFAAWRRDLVLDEVRVALSRREIEPTFDRLRWLSDWLIKYDAPGLSWRETQTTVRDVVCEEFCEDWLRAEEWGPAVQALENLASLIPDDPAIVDRQVDTLQKWGRWLRAAGRLLEAEGVYRQALEKVKRGEVSADQIEMDLLETQLARAQRHLDQADLSQATQIYQEILQARKEGDHLKRADQIRKALYAHSQGLAEPGGLPRAPDWEGAQQALYQLVELGLDNPDVVKWRQEMSLREMKALLDADNLDMAFHALARMQPDPPWESIESMLDTYVREHIQHETQALAVEALRRLGETLDAESDASRWVCRELTTVGDLIREELKDLPAARQAYVLARDFGKKWG
jgi:hypothetical protein